MKITSLSDRKLKIANSIMSAYSFYYIVGDALLNRKPLSVVRMGDGERTLLDDIVNAQDLNISSPTWDEAWHKRMGTYGISRHELYRRLMEAGNSCTHFAPSVSGLVLESYDLFNFFTPRNTYVDNFFVNIWSDEQKIALYKEAQSIIFIHRSRSAADALQIRAKKYLGVRVRFIELSDWTMSERVIEEATNDTESRLVLFAGGPASKYISPAIAASNKVVLDIGNTTDDWLLSNLT